jgi:hypothetical protein
MHIYIAKKIFSHKECDILKNLAEEDQIYALDLIEEFILATDLSKHEHFVSQFATKYGLSKGGVAENDSTHLRENNKLDESMPKHILLQETVSEHRTSDRGIKNIEICVMVKIADIANTSKSTKISLKTNFLVTGELNNELKILNKELIKIGDSSYYEKEIMFLEEYGLFLFEIFVKEFKEVEFLVLNCYKNIEFYKRKLKNQDTK